MLMVIINNLGIPYDFIKLFFYHLNQIFNNTMIFYSFKIKFSLCHNSHLFIIQPSVLSILVVVLT